jgi:hypothetical protein
MGGAPATCWRWIASQRNDEGAEKLLRQILDNAAAPADVRNLASLALARLLYERKNYEEAWTLYAQVRLPLVEQDVVLLEWAWDRIASEDNQRSLGMVVGLGAPIYRRLFAPERDLIRAMALRRLCQYRAAHLAVRDFREHYGALVRKVRDRVRVCAKIRRSCNGPPGARGWRPGRACARACGPRRPWRRRWATVRWPSTCKPCMARAWPTPRRPAAGLGRAIDSRG